VTAGGGKMYEGGGGKTEVISRMLFETEIRVHNKGME